MDTHALRRPRGAHRLTATALAAAGALALAAGSAGAATPTPRLGAATKYLVTADTANGLAGGTTLSGDGYYEAGEDFADFGLTMDGAYALAAAGTHTAALRKVVGFVENGRDGSGRTVEEYTGTAPDDEVKGAYPYVSSGGIGKEALLAEMVGDDPHAFGGQNLIALLDGEVCTAETKAYPVCAAPGNYENAFSTFSQALGIIAQLRAGDTTVAMAPIDYLLSQQQATGAWSALIPAGGDSDVDSTAMAVMALNIAPGVPARGAANRGVNWIASQQEADGGFPGASGDSTNSAALALMALRLSSTPNRYAAQVNRGLAFLAAEQNSDGGFDIATGDPGSDVRASTQAVNGVVGTSFARISDPLGPPR